MAVGMLDQDVNDQLSVKVPQLYQKGIQQQLYTMERFWLYIFDGIYQSVVCYYIIVYMVMDGIIDPNGYGIDKNLMGTYLGFFAVITVNISMSFSNFSWVWITHFSMYAEIAVFTAYVIIWASNFESPTFGQTAIIFQQPSFYFGTLLAVVIGLLPKFVLRYAKQYFNPTDTDIIQEIQKYHWKPDTLPNLDIQRELSTEILDSSSNSEAPSSPNMRVEHRRFNSEPIKTSQSHGAITSFASSNLTSLDSSYPPPNTKRKSVSDGHPEEQKHNSIRRTFSESNFPKTKKAPPPVILTPHPVIPAAMAFSTKYQKPSSPNAGDESTDSLNSDTTNPLSQSGPSFQPRSLNNPKTSTSHRVFSSQEARNSIQEILIQPLNSLGKKTEEFFKNVVPRKLRNTQTKPPGRSMVFMGNHSEVQNTGFCFSHDEGMEPVITPLTGKPPLEVVESMPEQSGLQHSGLEVIAENDSIPSINPSRRETVQKK